MRNYINSKFKIFYFQKKYQYSIIDKNLKPYLKKRKLSGKIIFPKLNVYKRFKFKISNSYLKLNINDENMSFVYKLAKLLKISEKSFLKSLNSFSGLPHRYEIFLKRKNCVFINDSKATSFQASMYALKNTNNIFWIVGGLPKKKDKFNFKNLKKNIIKTYIIGKNTNFFKRQFQKKLKFIITKNLKNSITQIIKDIKFLNKKQNTVLFSPASASFDQFLNFEERGDKFKQLSNFYAKKYI